MFSYNVSNKLEDSLLRMLYTQPVKATFVWISPPHEWDGEYSIINVIVYLQYYDLFIMDYYKWKSKVTDK